MKRGAEFRPRKDSMKSFYLYDSEKMMIIGAILVLAGIALMIPGIGTIGLYWPGKTVIMRDMIMGIIGGGVSVYGAYTFAVKGIYG